MSSSQQPNYLSHKLILQYSKQFSIMKIGGDGILLFSSLCNASSFFKNFRLFVHFYTICISVCSLAEMSAGGARCPTR
jgi:hypothetical protein